MKLSRVLNNLDEHLVGKSKHTYIYDSFPRDIDGDRFLKLKTAN